MNWRHGQAKFASLPVRAAGLCICLLLVFMASCIKDAVVSVCHMSHGALLRRQRFVPLAARGASCLVAQASAHALGDVMRATAIVLLCTMRMLLQTSNARLANSVNCPSDLCQQHKAPCESSGDA